MIKIKTILTSLSPFKAAVWDKRERGFGLTLMSAILGLVGIALAIVGAIYLING